MEVIATSLKKEREYFIRKFSTTVAAKDTALKEMLTLTAIPFDDHINHQAVLENIKVPLIQSFLSEIESKLLEESRSLSLKDLCRQMAIADGGNEYLKPKNVGLLFFSDEPHRFFPYAQIEVVYFPEGEGGDILEEEYFKGPLDHQLKSALRHIEGKFITERTVKSPDPKKPRARRFHNYPIRAIEEALVNAVYHRSYEIREPIEVRITKTSITIVSHPGPDVSILDADIKAGTMKPRRYRNRRIGDFLKELDFTEGRGTGVPKIRNALKANGSPDPIFYTDPGRLCFWTEIPIHPEFLEKEVTTPIEAYDGITDGAPVEAPVEALVNLPFLNQTELTILGLCATKTPGRKEILEFFGHKTFSGNMKKALSHLKELGLIELTIKEKPNSQNQRYKITAAGKARLDHSSS